MDIYCCGDARTYFEVDLLGVVKNCEISKKEKKQNYEAGSENQMGLHRRNPFLHYLFFFF